MLSFFIGGAMVNYNEQIKQLNACGAITKIRKIYQIGFYLSLVAAVFIFLKLSGIEADFIFYFIVAVAYASAYAVLLLLRAVEHLIWRVFYLEHELATKGVIYRPSPQEQNNY